MPTLAEIWVHPVKSLAGQRVDSSVARERGLRHDRSWVVVGPDAIARTQRDWPRMALVRVAVSAGRLTLSCDGFDPLDVDFDAEGNSSRRCRAIVWDDEVDGADGGDAAAAWLTSALGTECRLVHMDAQAQRTTYPDGGPGRSVRFADELPLLLVTSSALVDLDRRAPGLADVRRFRPNLVIDDCEPYAEDTWKRVRVGAVELEIVKPASRCVLVCVDPDTAERHPRAEPLRTLAGYRRQTSAEYTHKPDRIYLGVRAAVARPGELRVGDDVEVLG